MSGSAASRRAQALVFFKLGLKADAKSVHRTLNRPPKGKGWVQGVNMPQGLMCRPAKVREAIEHYGRAYEIFPDIVALNQIAIAYEMLGELEQARERPESSRSLCAIKAAAAVVALGLVACATVPPEAPVSAYVGARVIVGDGAVIENATLLVRGERFEQVGTAAKVRVPAGATRVGLAGKTVMPMLIDTHVHLGAGREAVVRDLRRRAYYGVSAALSLGTDGFDVLDLRGEAIPGAGRFLSAGRGITMQEPGRTTIPYWVTTEAEARNAVRELAEHNVNIVKIWVDTRDGKYGKLTPGIYGAIIDEAHKRGLRVTAHIFDLEDAKGLIRAGVDALAHGVRDQDVDEELVAMFRARPNLVLTPNLPERGVKVDLDWLKPSLARSQLEILERANTDRPLAQQFFGIQARNLAKLNAAGARITLGTDGNRPWGPHDEMLDMVVAGMTPMQVIVAATRNSAEFLRLRDTGTLEAGKSADFIVLDANPLEDITHTRRISAVVLRGTPLDRSKPPQ